MRSLILTLVFIVIYHTSYSQDTIPYFSDAIKNNIEVYKHASNMAYERGDIKEGKRLFDSLVEYKLVGTKFDDFSIKTYSSKNIQLKRIDKPIFIITYSSWLVIPEGEIAALNVLAKEHQEDLKIIVIFWDKKPDLKKIAPLFNDDVEVCYANENYYNDSHLVATIKHSLGFPTSIFIDENKKVVSIKHFVNKVKPKTPLVEAITISYNNFNKNINESLVNTTVMINNYKLSEN